MARPLVATKLYVPHPRPGVVARPRLVHRLSHGVQGRLTLVSAPAGFGKTTLLASWLAQTSDEDRAVAWLSLDPSDHDPLAFWTGVVTALRQAVPGIDQRALDLLTASPDATVPALTAVLNDLAAAPGPVWLVLDDYHHVDGRAVAAGMAFLLEHLPAHVHVVLSTRADPDLPLGRWRAGGELVEVRAADLRFTSGEATDYLDAAAPVPLTAAQVQALEDRTEGWIAALQLAALSLQGRADVATFITGFTGDDRYVVDYLVEEVLARQPEQVREFLLFSAVLDRLSGPLCDAVLGRGDAVAMLRTLERDNLFLVALDDRREWFRYHQLFRDVLLARLIAEQPELAPVLHARAAEWFEQHGFTDEAVEHALLAGDVHRATTLVELAVPEIRRHRHEAKMQDWLSALPDDVVRGSPVLSVFAAALRLTAGDLDAALPWLDDAELALAAPPTPDERQWAPTDELRALPATIAMYRASVAQAHGDVEGTAQQARRALELTGPDDHLARGGALGFLAMAAWAQGDVSQAYETFDEAVASLHAAGNLVDELGSHVVLADLCRAAGRPVRARELCERALRQAESLGEPLARASRELHVALAELDVEVGDLDRAGAHLDAASTLADRAPVTESDFRLFVARALLAAASGEDTAATGHLDRAEELHRPGFFPDVRPIPALRARLQVARGDLVAAGHWAREREVSPTDPAVFLREYDHLTLARLLLARHRAHLDPDAADLALGLLERLRGAATASARAGSLVEVRLLTALAHHALGQATEALRALTDALTLAPEPEGYVRVFLDEGAPALELLRAAAAAEGVDGRAARVLAAATAGPPGIRPLPDPLSERELQVLRLLDTELSGPEIARELFISPNTLRTHTKHVFTKLGVTSRRAAVARARERGLLGTDPG